MAGSDCSVLVRRLGRRTQHSLALSLLLLLCSMMLLGAAFAGVALSCCRMASCGVRGEGARARKRRLVGRDGWGLATCRFRAYVYIFFGSVVRLTRCTKNIFSRDRQRAGGTRPPPSPSPATNYTHIASFCPALTSAYMIPADVDCCTGDITKAGVVCGNGNTAPCIIDDSGYTAKTPSPTTGMPSPQSTPSDNLSPTRSQGPTTAPQSPTLPTASQPQTASPQPPVTPLPTEAPAGSAAQSSAPVIMSVTTVPSTPPPGVVTSAPVATRATEAPLGKLVSWVFSSRYGTYSALRMRCGWGRVRWDDGAGTADAAWCIALMFFLLCFLYVSTPLPAVRSCPLFC